MKYIKYILVMSALLSFSIQASAEFGRALLREGSSEPEKLDVGKESMVWVVLEFNNRIRPSFPLRVLDMHFETAEGKQQEDYFRYPMTGEAINGKSQFLVGISLPIGKYRFKKISGHVSDAPALISLGQIDFEIDIPFQVKEPGKHYYLGNMTVLHVESHDPTDQHPGYVTPFVSQATSGMYVGTLRIRLSDRFEEDQSAFKRKFQVLKNSAFEKNLFKNGYVNSKGSSWSPRLIKMTEPIAPAAIVVKSREELLSADKHEDDIPPATGFAKIEAIDAVPRLGAKEKEIYKKWLGTPYPRAVAISGKGDIGIGNESDAMTAAVVACEKFKSPCRLYAVDGTVVFEPFIEGQHQKPIPYATNFAPLKQVDSIPRLGPKEKASYKEWLGKPNPKAVAISGRGHIAFGYGDDAMRLAIGNCEKEDKDEDEMPCRLYAVDDAVVFDPFPLEKNETPLATNFAQLADVDAVPKLGPKGKQLYKEWLGKPNPKAVAVSSAGAIARSYGQGAMDKAITSCEKFNNPCRLYAVNDAVVFVPFSREQHERPIPPATNFAQLGDIDAVPRLSAKGKELYREWLTKPFPRAMAISDKGGFARGYGANAMQQAVQNCEKNSGNPCRLYAVDDQVVWTVVDASSTKGMALPASVKHAMPVPASTGFAALSDVNAVPKLGPRGKELYLEWLKKPFPRAVAVSDKGDMARSFGTNAMQQAVQNCEKLFGNPCRLYAVDDQVVWKTE